MKRTGSFRQKPVNRIWPDVVFVLFMMLSASLTQAQNKLYWVQTGGADRILRANLNGSNVEQIITGLNSPEGLALDDIAGKMYWSERLAHVIKSANLDGSGVRTLVSGIGNVYGIALDRANSKLYWIEPNVSGNDFIRRINLDGAGLENVVTTNNEIGRAVALDIPGGKIYWSYAGPTGVGPFGKVKRADLDGTNIEDIITSVRADGLALDLGGGKVYWTEPNRIKRANLDGTAIEVLVSSGASVGETLALDLDEGKMYWGNEVGILNDNLYRANLDGSNIEIIESTTTNDPQAMVVARVPLAPSPALPANGSLEHQTFLTLDWSDVARTNSYQCQVSTAADFSTLEIDQGGISGSSLQISGLATCTTYHWRVRAVNAVGSSPWSATWTFTTIKVAPAQPNLLSPANGQTGLSLDPTLIWQQAFCADSYQLEVASDPNFTAIVFDQQNITTTSQVLSGLLFDSNYYWRVKAANDLGTSNWSEVRSFRTIIEAPAAPTLMSPADSDEMAPVNTTFSWNAAARAESYQLQVSTAVSFSTTVVDRANINETSYAVTDLANSTTYFWRLNASNAGGTSDWSSIWQFTTIAATPVAPTLASPPDGATGISTNLTVRWNASGGATSYHLQVATSPSFATPVIDHNNLAETEFASTGLSNNTNYFWRVRASNAGGASNWSAIWSFTTAAPTSVRQSGTTMPKEFRLGQNYPNPFNPTTTIEFDLPNAGLVTLTVYNSLGKEVMQVLNRELAAGKYTVQLDAPRLASGLYLYRLQAGSVVLSRKMLLVR